MYNLMLLPVLFSVVITRDAAISKAQTYLNLSWSPTVDTCTIKDYQGKKISDTQQPFKSYYKKGITYTWEAYVWGGIDNTSKFENRIDNKCCAGGYNTNSYGYYIPGQASSGSAAAHFLAGIDCAAFANDCLSQTIWQGISVLKDNCLEIERDKVEKGDIWVKSHHIRLSAGGTDIYESHSETGYRPGVEYRRGVANAKYTPYSIFPQFSDESPEDGELVDLPEDETTIDIALTIKASGRINTTGVRMFIQKDGESEKNIGDITLDKKEDKTWELKKEDFDVGDGGNFTVKVVARNDIASNGYKDEYEWEFTIDPAPPIVRSTDPTKDAKDVPIDKSPITINFSKPMDETATAGAVQAPFPCGIVWAGDQELQLIPDDVLDYCSEYTITVTEAAMDTAGVHLDGNKDGRAGDNYPFTFTAEPPEMDLYLNPFVANVEEGYPLKVNLYANGSELKKEIDCNMDFKVYNPGGWSVLTPHTAIGLRLTAKV